MSRGDMNRRRREWRGYGVLTSCVLVLVEDIGNRFLLRMEEQCV